MFNSDGVPNNLETRFDVLSREPGKFIVVRNRTNHTAHIVDENGNESLLGLAALEGYTPFTIVQDGVENPPPSSPMEAMMFREANAIPTLIDYMLFETPRVNRWKEAHDAYVTEPTDVNAALLVWSVTNFAYDFATNGFPPEPEDDPEFDARKEEVMDMVRDIMLGQLLSSLVSQSDDDSEDPLSGVLGSVLLQ